MKTEFEADLSEAFAARAARVPVGAASRLRAMDYQPRERRLRAPVTVGAGVLAGAATAGAVLSVVLGSAAPAYAGWSASPAADTTAPSPSADTSCLNQLASTPAAPGGTGTGQGAWQNVLTDVRGPFTVALFQNDGSYAACFTSSSFTEVDQVSSSGGSASSSGRVSVNEQAGPGGTGSSSISRVGVSNTGSGSLTQVLQNHLTTSSDGPYTLVDGRTQPGVTAVTLVLDDGQDVVTSVADGWFVAWWPGSSNATSAQVTTASGTASEPLVEQPMPIPPPLPQAGSGSANSGNSGSGPSTSGNSGTGPSASSNR